MVQVSKHGYISDRYDDPDSTAGSEYRIYFCDPYEGLNHIPAVLGWLRAARIYCSVAVEIPGEARDAVNMFTLPERLTVIIGKWRGRMLFHNFNDVGLYVMSRDPFKDEGLTEVVMRAPPGCFR